MTPLIKEFVQLTDQPDQMMWFDIGHAPDSTFDFEVDGEHLTNLPFQRMAVCGLDAGGRKFMLALWAGDGHVSVAGVVLWENGKYEQINTFAYVDTPDGVRLLPPSNQERQLKPDDCLAVMSVVGYMLDSLDAGGTAYQPTAKANSPTNKRRIANGKPALIYDWRTVVVEPKQAKSESLGGTHASPRQHERRGHWRVTSAGRKVWVRNCTVGDASKGTVFHDYKVAA
ncbi:MAG: hypothetical protein PHD99_04740 [Candidatus Moranbacteria bacterium]|nr:hypothetical protein [Candidatus Moranbacteria bacterium]